MRHRLVSLGQVDTDRLSSVWRLLDLIEKLDLLRIQHPETEAEDDKAPNRPQKNR